MHALLSSRCCHGGGLQVPPGIDVDPFVDGLDLIPDRKLRVVDDA